jgi:hypothetical protein
MCAGDNPILRAMPFIVIGSVSLITILLLYVIPAAKKWKHVERAKIVMIIIVMISLLLAFMQFMFLNKCA